MELFTGGKIGEMFAALAFSGALVALWSFLAADRRSGVEKQQWERMGMAGFGLHILSIFGMIGTLFYLIYSHQYQYHYVWSHSSNELPVYYMISCFWEGQEGSFLLWTFWHSILGGILMFSKHEFRNAVLAILASIELILTSMVLGTYLNDSWTTGIFFLLGLLPGLYMGWRWLNERDSLAYGGNFHLASVLLSLAFLVLLLRGQMGFVAEGGPWYQHLDSVDGWAFGLLTLFLWGYGLFYLSYLNHSAKASSYLIWEIIAGAALFGVVFLARYFGPEIWKVGSTPFVLLQSVFPDNEAYAINPDFVPANGSGLNPLLQNYWMVIHPPTLFLGFASTVVPFAFVMAGLIKGKYSEWLRPALPWMSFSVMILGIGIIMGGYWAYETLNFGGYWNWDPVENSSLVPWLAGVASLHAMLIYRKTKAYLKLTMIMVISTFLLVLYSTFLTRSGILGETSVHTFTDLGLSGQLILLVAVYSLFVLVTMWLRWPHIPQREDESKLWSAEFMLFLGVLIFTFSGLVIILATSLPVFNAIFGTEFAPPAQVQLFYYKWTIWFAILFGVVSGLGQFLWWRIKGKKTIADAIFRPFLLTVLIGSAAMIGMWYSGMEFAFDSKFAESLEAGKAAGGLQLVMAYLGFFFMALADELLLFSAIFGVAANTDVLFALLRKNRKGLKVMGGTVVHIGFGLMLLGMLFSSGFDEIISKNLHPEDLASFPEQEKIDNVPLPRGVPNQIMGYQVTYTGRKGAEAPVQDLRILERNAIQFKVAFRDANGDRFAVELPVRPFLEEEDRQGEAVHPTADTDGQPTSGGNQGEIDLVRLTEMLNSDLASFEPERLNTRMLFGLEFQSMKDSSEQFALYPESEINDAMGGLLPHPARKIFWDRDLYVFTSSIPAQENLEPKLLSYGLRIGDTARIGKTIIQLVEMRNLKEVPQLQNKEFDVAAAAHILAFSGRDTFFANPIFMIQGNRPGMVPSSIDELGMDFAFVGVVPEEDLVQIQVRYLDPQSDYVIIKAISKPFINLLWLGTFILTIGFLISIYRRFRESHAARK